MADQRRSSRRPSSAQRCPLAVDAAGALETAVSKGRLSQRGAQRVLRLAWTVADLAGSDRPLTEHVLEALHLRTDVVHAELLRLGSGGLT